MEKKEEDEEKEELQTMTEKMIEKVERTTRLHY
jgi:hypothetical protein